MPVRFNAPVTLSFVLLCSLVMLVDQYLFPGFAGAYLRAPGAEFDPTQFLHYFELFFYVFGHENWSHLWNNLLFLLLLGPILEEKYTPRPLLMMMLTTTIITSIFNVLLRMPALIGSSAFVFMMIMLVSFARTKTKGIPVSFILVFIVFLLAEITGRTVEQQSGVSNLAHIVGGICGTIFGFLRMTVTNADPNSPPNAMPR